MKNIMIRTVSLLLLMSILSLSLFSCSDSSDDSGKSSQNTGNVHNETSSEAGETKEDPRKPYFDKKDFDGAIFTVLYPDWGTFSDYFFAEEENGDPMNDAIYKRRTLTEEYLNITLSHKMVGGIVDIMPKVQNTVLGGTDDYQLVLTHCIHDVGNMVTGGLLYNWKDLPDVDFSRPYWNHDIVESMSVHGRVYYTVSDYMIPAPCVTYFNKDIVTEYKLENPYELVKSGKWTLDKFIEMASQVSEDLNGDGKFDVNDKYGVATENDWELNSFFYSCGQHLTKKNDDGSYSLVLNTEKTYDIINKMSAIMNDKTCSYIWNYGSPEEETAGISKGKCLFEFGGVGGAAGLRQTEVNFGIIPYPKYDETQEKYENNDWGGLMCIPVTITNPELVGSVCEMLAHYSAETTRPAYYDILLKGKVVRDDDSVEMLDIIFENIVFDPGVNYFGFADGMMDLFYTIPFLVGKKGSTDFASWYEKREKKSIKAMEKFLEKINEQ